MSARALPLALLCLLLGGCGPSMPEAQPPSAEIVYVPVGDSYTIGTGIDPQFAWPALLERNLRAAGIPVRIAANPARNGYSTQDALEEELPVFERFKPGFATLMIGVNDEVRGAHEDDFRARFTQLLDGMLSTMSAPGKLLVVTIPDYTATPTGSTFAVSGHTIPRLEAFNAIIRDEAAERGLPVVDVEPLSRAMADDLSLVADDGLHPSAAEHALWEEEIREAALALLR